MNNIKKLSFIFLLALIVLLFSSNNKIAGASLSDYAHNLDEKVTWNVDGPLTANIQHIETVNNGTKDKNSPKYFFNPHTVQWVDFDTDNDYRVVTYSGLNADKWKAMTTRQACADFEKNHPGWLVVAGINGDFFDNSGATTFQPTNNFMTMSDMFRAEKAGADYRNNICWTNDGKVIVGSPDISEKAYLRLLDGDKVTSQLEINNYNNNIAESGISLITTDSTKDFDLNNVNVYVCEYSINRLSSKGMIFVKGKVVDINNLSHGSTKPDKGYFYLCDKDDSLKSILKVGQELKCEHIYLNGYQNVDNSIGYIHQVLVDGVAQYAESNDDFCYITHPRTLIGFRKDGSTVFMVVDGRGTSAEMRVGATLFEAGILLGLQGCVNGYNLDGGGSSTLVVRNNDGSFRVVNTPSDGAERSDGNHCLVIRRDPGFKITAKNTTSSSITLQLNITNNDLYKNVENLKIKFNDKEYSFTNNELTIDHLSSETTYNFNVEYDGLSVYDEANKVKKMQLVSFTTTEYQAPDPKLIVKDISKNSVIISRDMEILEADYFNNIIVHIGDSSYNMGNKAEFEINDLIDDTEYEVYFEYTINDPVNGTFNKSTIDKMIKIKTLSFNKPIIDEFKLSSSNNNVYSFDYKISDNDRVLKNVKLVVNGNVVASSTSRRGSIEFTDTDLYNDKLCKLVIVYEKDDVKGEIETEIITIKALEKPAPTPDVEPTPAKKKCGKKSAELIISLISISTMLMFAFKNKKD